MSLSDNIIAKDGTTIKLTFYAHASIGIEWNDLHIYIDPVGEKYGIDYSFEPKADLILITHHHRDHQDKDAVAQLSNNDTVVYVSSKCTEIDCAQKLKPNCESFIHGIKIETIPAYNVTSDHFQFHPLTDNDLGYILTLGETKVLIAGDTEDTPELLGLKGIDVAFLPVNQPYTMTIEQVVRVAKSISPKVLYPYHCGSQMGVTDVTALPALLADVCEVRIRNMN